MKTERISKGFLLKWTVLCLLSFVLALPAGAQVCKASTNTYQVSISKGYLALRNAKAYNSANEIARLNNGDLVEVRDYSDPDYWYVYAPAYGLYGYVNNDYLLYNGPAETYSECGGDDWTVSVDTGYLALRTAKAYDSRNEIGELHTGDIFQVTEYDDDTYWYGYSPRLDSYGYVNKNYLYGGSSGYSLNIRTVNVAKGYLALRSAKAYDDRNEIGQLYSGESVEVLDASDSTYWYVYSFKLECNGYVNKDYLLERSSASYSTMTVSVAKGYLALRNAKAYDTRNEIGELYNGETVQVIDANDSTYWYVYSYKLGKSGFVNKDYLVGGSANITRTVSVAKGYLALRDAMSYDSANEIGQLYSGDTVQVIDSRDSTYWYVYSPLLNKYGYVNSQYLY